MANESSLLHFVSKQAEGWLLSTTRRNVSNTMYCPQSEDILEKPELAALGRIHIDIMWSPVVVGSMFVLYVAFLFGERDRLLVQRARVLYFREHLSRVFGLNKLREQQWAEENQARFQILASAWVLTLTFSMLTFAYEGNLYISVNLTYVVAGFALLLFTNQPKQTLVYYARFNVLQNAVLLWYFDSVTRTTIMRRSIVLRTVASLIFFESLEETFLHLMLMSVLLNTRFCERESEEERALVLLPIKLFVLGVLPLRVMGPTTDWFSAVKGQDFSLQLVARFVNRMSLMSCMVPMYLMFGAFVETSLKEMSLCVGLTYLCLGLALAKSGSRMVHALSPSSFALDKSFTAPSTVGWGDLFQPVLFAVALVTWAVGRQVVSVLATTGAVILISAQRHMQCDEMQAKLFIVTGTLLVVTYKDLWYSSMVTFLSLTSAFWCFGLTCAKEVIFAQIVRENATESFLSHAIKQKFASLGIALEHVVVHHPHLQLLHTAMMECRMGHARCHAATLFRKLNQGEVRTNKRYFANVWEQVHTTTAASVLFDGNEDKVLSTRFPVSAVVETDWEILHLILSELARKRHRLVKVRLRHRCEVVFQFDRPIMQSQYNVITMRLMRELGGQLVCNVLHVPVHFQDATSNSISSMSSSSLSSSFSPSSPPPASLPSSKFTMRREGGKHDVLSKLTFALVDDSALVRNNFRRVLQHSLGVPEANIFTFGDTADNARDFPRSLCLHRVDIAVFDQNLDYEHDLIKGSGLAKQAKALGFTGCLVLHSSDTNMSQLEQNGVFHGAVEKTANSDAFVQGICLAWLRYTTGDKFN